jgi:hypothetical protein
VSDIAKDDILLLLITCKISFILFDDNKMIHNTGRKKFSSNYVLKNENIKKII